ncbi:hypothetical protein ERL59_20070 [Chengkuizengella sp. YPA3-1-1]|uniref:Spore germination protein (Amino acid permease) n=2 Tax=Chengkuizengella marina TaxID=2507566 RepID=A0A6N9Q8S0_9BACL|nr:hypothetical protein [Chengkuizengella marina]
MSLATARVPQILSSDVNKDAWISVLISGLLLQLVIIMIWLLLKRYPTITWYQILSATLGSFMGKIISLSFAGYFIYIATMEVLSAAELLQFWMLTFTPKFIIIILVTFAGILLARENLQTIIRFYTFTVILIIIFPILATVTFINSDIRYILPLGSTGTSAILNASYESFCSLTGIIAMIMIYVQTKGSALQKLGTISLANLCMTLFFSFLLFSASVVLSPELLTVAKFYAIFTVRDLTLGLIQRIDLYYVLIGLLFKIVSCVTFLYLSASGIGHVLGKNHHREAVPYLGLIVILLALSPLFDTTNINNIVTVTFVVIIPSLLLIFSYMFNRNKNLM